MQDTLKPRCKSKKNYEVDAMKKIVSILAAVQFIFIMSSWSFAASDKCTVVRAENNRLILECNKKTESFQINDKIKIKSMKKKSIEGC